MIHVLDFDSNIIDFIGNDDNNVIRAEYKRDADSELLDITMLSKRAEHFKKRNRVIIQDKNGIYREFIIVRVEDEGQYVTIECNASYLHDIGTAKPILAGKYEKTTVNDKLLEVLKDTGWTVGDCDYAGIRTMSWTSTQTPYEMIKLIETNHELKASYEIVISGNEVTERKVNMREPVPLFKGKEILYGKDLVEMKRTIDFSEVKTALLALGPENDKGQRITTVVVDDEAQEQFNLPQRYIWGIYEPESNEQNMTLERLTTLATTELNKRKSASISYEISVVDIEKEYSHEIVRYGDLVRIKNNDFTPSLYAESEVIGFTHDLISDDCTYTFGRIIEYKEDDLLKYFRSKLDSFNQKLNDNISNVNTIVQDTLDTELQYFEKKIIKSNTAPSNPVNDVLWLDTSNPNVPILKRYWNGQWIKSSVDNVEQIGGVTREKALFSELNNTFINLTIQHSKLLNEMYEVINNEYLVDASLKLNLNTNLDKTIATFSNIKTNLESMTPDTATIGKLVDTQSLFLKYREELQELYKVVEQAKISINARFKLLQSQYTDEKFNKALSEVADKFGLQVSEDNQLIGEPNVIQKAISIVTEQTDNKLANYVKSEDYQTDKNGIVERLNNSDSERQQLSNQIADRVTLTQYLSGIKDAKDYADNAIDGLEIGFRNLIPNSDFSKGLDGWTVMYGSTAVKNSGQNAYVFSNTADKFVGVRTPNFDVVAGQTYTLTIEGSRSSNMQQLDYVYMMYDTSGVQNQPLKVNSFSGTIGDFSRVSVTFTATTTKVGGNILIAKRPTTLGAEYQLGFYIRNVKLEKGSKATDHTVAPEDTEQKLTTMKTEILQDGKKISQEVSQQIYNSSSKTLNQTLSQYINSISTGHQFTYDENGNITNFSVGSSGIKLNAKVIDMNNGDVIIKDGVTTITDAYINKLFSKQATINYLDAIGITARTLQAKDKQASVNIENGSITMNRDSGARMDIGLDGIQSFNAGGSLRFSLTPTLVTTSAVGTSVSNVYLGAAPTGEARIVDMNGIPGDGAIGSYAYRPIRTLAIKFPLNANGYIGIDGNELRIMSDGLVEGGYKSVRADKGYFSTVDANNEISGAHFYIRPKRGGELRATYNDGGETSYANFRSNGIYAPWIDYNGHLPGSHFYIRPAYGGEVRLTATGTTNNWANLRSDGIYAPWIDFNGQIPGSHLYIRPGSGGEVKFTRTGTTDVWADIRFGSWNAMSHEKYKNNIEKWNYNVLDIYKNDLVLYSYKVNSESDTLYARIHHGIVLRENSNLDQFPAEWRNGDGFDGNEVLWWNTKAVQELAFENDELRNKISDLENRLKILEDKLNG